MKARLLCRTTPGETRTFDLARGEAILGCEPGAEVELALDGVSRRHARVAWDGKNHWIEDLKSAGGTFLNGQSVQRDKLRHLDVITLGRKVDLLFVKRGEAHSVRKRGVLAATLAPASPELLVIDLPLGETSLGRNTACNVVLDKAAISKMHARIERSAEQVVVRDLESVNGTFVNGARVTLAVLADQDLLSLAGVEGFRVTIRTGEVLATASDGAAPTQSTKPVAAFSNDWKTRFDWNQDEGDELVVPPQRRDADATLAPSHSRSTAATDAIEVVPPPTGAPTAPPEVKTSALPVVVPHSPGAPLASEGQTFVPGQLNPTSRPRIAEVRLVGSGFDLVANEPGIHSLGRSVDSGLRLNHATVSRHHARLILTEDRASALIQDLGGANGTLLNGALLKKAEPLGEGDIVQLGDVKLLVHIRLQTR